MTQQMMDTDDLLFGFEALSPDAIELDSTQINRAIQLSEQVQETRQWQTYLNALALFGLEEWLEERSADLAIDSESSSIFQPQLADAIEAVCNLQVGEFKLCLLATGSLIDEEIDLPRAVIDLPEFAAHFYVLVEVIEEWEQVMVKGVLRHDRLLRYREAVNLQPDEDWTYALPLTWFDNEPDSLLLYLRLLEPEAIPLPELQGDRSAEVCALQADWERVLPQLQAGDRPWWQILNWEQAAAILTHSELLDGVYQLQSGGVTVTSLGDRLSQIAQGVMPAVINTAMWLQDKLDRWAQEAAWVLLPPLTPEPVMLRSTETLEDILQQLQEKGMEIATQARGAYQDLRLADVPMRLYAVTWAIESETSEPEWTLLLILSGQPDNELPVGVTLQISDETEMLVQQTLAEEGDILYAQVIGTLNETFGVKITLASGETQVLPPFGFQSDRLTTGSIFNC